MNHPREKVSRKRKLNPGNDDEIKRKNAGVLDKESTLPDEVLLVVIHHSHQSTMEGEILNSPINKISINFIELLKLGLHIRDFRLPSNP